MGKEKRAAKRLLRELGKVNEDLAKSEEQLARLQTEKAKMLADTLTESPGNRNVSLSDLLNKDQIQAVVDILNRPNLDDIAQTKLIKDYLRRFDADLQAKGVLPDYLAYVIIHNAANIRQMAALWN